MFFDQNSFSELTSKIFGQVLLAVQRASRDLLLIATACVTVIAHTNETTATIESKSVSVKAACAS